MKHYIFKLITFIFVTFLLGQNRSIEEILIKNKFSSQSVRFYPDISDKKFPNLESLSVEGGIDTDKPLNLANLKNLTLLSSHNNYEDIIRFIHTSDIKALEKLSISASDADGAAPTKEAEERLAEERRPTEPQEPDGADGAKADLEAEAVDGAAPMAIVSASSKATAQPNIFVNFIDLGSLMHYVELASQALEVAMPAAFTLAVKDPVPPYISKDLIRIRLRES